MDKREHSSTSIRPKCPTSSKHLPVNVISMLRRFRRQSHCMVLMSHLFFGIGARNGFHDCSKMQAISESRKMYANAPPQWQKKP